MCPVGDVPILAGASLIVGNESVVDASEAWEIALGWLKEFRQGTKSGARERAGSKAQPKRDSISNWPEPDKIRHLKGETRSHAPQHNRTPAWPRAGFGLPINGRFQRLARDGSPLHEPGPFELRWRESKNGTEHDRLASPLIVKALPLADGQYLPCALWLNRAYPEGEVFLKGEKNSGAAFDVLVACNDQARFSALRDKASLREAFISWLITMQGVKEIAP
jgi:CRISPR-associated protein Cmr1